MDGLGETTVFAYDASGKLVAEYSTNISATPRVQYQTLDNLGTPRINTDQLGAVVARTDYMPYGEEIIGLGGRTAADHYTADDVRQGFTGYINDEETDLDFAQARMYANRLGRFTSVDPILMTEDRRFNPQSINLYGYTMNRPHFYTDLTGAIVKHPNSDSEAIYLAYRGWVYEQYKADPKKFGDLWATIQRLESSGVTYNISVADRSKYGDGVEGSVDLSSNGNEINVNIVLSGGTSQEFSQNSAFAHELEHARQFDNGEWGFILEPDKNGPITIDGKHYKQTTNGLDIRDETKSWKAMLAAANGFDNLVKVPHNSREAPLLQRLDGIKDEKADKIIARLNNEYEDLNRNTKIGNYLDGAKPGPRRPSDGEDPSSGRRAFGCVGGGCKW